MKILTILGLSLSSLMTLLSLETMARSTGQCGMASFYHHGRITANGERFNPGRLTAAHPWLPFGTRVRVVDQRTKRSVVVRINDRGPFTGRRIIDLTPVGMRAIAPLRAGVRRVCLHW